MKSEVIEKMDKIIIIFLVIDSLFLIQCLESKEERMKSFFKLTLPYIKQNSIPSQELNSIYQLLTNNEDIPEESDPKKTTKNIAPKEEVKRNIDDFGHLRFGRNGQNVNTRIKYNDPDYGHMRFG